ncbi:MAG: ATP-dependent Clp protease ATP-binding subunit [Candidatus Liptonbacteria bacterium]|nr:ATP-dependent Clp protease ATP-binding subunit [Candidatus Liptonbacteria bacterium]
MTEISEFKTVFNEPRLRMIYPGRILVRVSSAIGYVTFAAGTFAALISENSGLRYFGFFLVLFWLDRLRHAGQADIPLSELPKTGEVDLSKCILPKSYRFLERAFERSSVKQTNFYLEVAEALSSLDQVRRGLSRLDIKPEEFEQKLEGLLKESAASVESGEDRYAKASNLVFLACSQAIHSGHRFIQNCDFFSSLASLDDPLVKRLFHMFSVVPQDIESAMILSDMVKRAPRRGFLSGMIPESQRTLRHRVMNRAWTARPTPTLDRFAVDYTDLARAGDVGFLIGHDKEYARLVETLSRGVRPNALLIGEPGIGKETIIGHLAFDIIKDKVPKAIFDRRLVGLDIARMIAGASPQEVQQRIQDVAKEIMIAENIILYLPDIHNLLRTSGEAYLSAADALLPILQSDAFPVVGATYPKEFKRDIEQRSDFVGIFESINVSEISEEEAQRILTIESAILEKQTGISSSFGAVKTAVSLAKKYFHGSKFLPGSADDLLRSAIAIAKQKGEKKVSAEEIIAAAETKTNIPIHGATGEEAEALLKFEETVHERFIDQEEAVKAAGSALREYRSGLSRKGGPIASFLFVGPTGVGKTELAKRIAEIQFGSEALMARFDMTEYQDKKSFEKFIGSPDGSIRGALTDRILQKPYSLILLDEFEKAFPDILDLFLQVLDDGRLTDGLGRTVDFQNTIIIATSNAHSDIINSALSEGRSMSDIAEYLKKKLTDVFKPELLNRFSRVAIFKNLEPKDLARVTELQLKELSKSLFEQGIQLKFDPSVTEYVVKIGYDPAFGARPIRRAIEEKLRASLAEKILGKEIIRGSEILVSAENGELTFRQNQQN